MEDSSCTRKYVWVYLGTIQSHGNQVGAVSCDFGFGRCLLQKFMRL